MNISQPISSTVETVEFTFLTETEIRAISVKRIENDSTFDNLLNPVPGGLYDPALGSWGDSICSTCNLNQSSCPGHAGHIELPVPVYHPVFLDQVLRLLRAQCVYCKGLRLRQRDVHLYSCKLRLLQHGLLQAADLIDAVGEDFQGLQIPGVTETAEAEEEGSGADNLIRAREFFVKRQLKEHKATVGDVRKGKHEGALEIRRELIKEFMAAIPKPKRCDTCGGISPPYRKDAFVTFFEKPLSERDAAKMAQTNLRTRDAMTAATPVSKTKSNGYTSDEAIADVDSSASDADGDVNMAEPNSGSSSESEGQAAKVSGGQIKASARSQRYITAMEVRERLRELFDKEQEVLSLVYNSKPLKKKAGKVSADMFFLQTLLVPPNRFRPEARTGDSQISEAQQNSLYKLVLRSCGTIARVHQSIGGATTERRARTMTDLHQAWTDLQNAVNSLIDKDKNPVMGAAAKRNEEGIKQKLEKKEGLFRKNMMGKRVNFAARSVISPDPNIETNEIGVPPVFARKLTFPEPVTSHNFRDMQRAVINGVDKWPGAAAIEYENGQITNLRGKSADDRIALANQLLAPTDSNTSGVRNKKVYRHLTNGDVVLMNRQPTLHKPSIMGHRVRVLPGEKTIRMHYANCNTYNADFDGDEMNMHFPQNEVARAEALQIADTDHQYLSGTAGKPLRGLIQDHISVSVSLCIAQRPHLAVHDPPVDARVPKREHVQALLHVPPLLRLARAVPDQLVQSEPQDETALRVRHHDDLGGRPGAVGRPQRGGELPDENVLRGPAALHVPAIHTSGANLRIMQKYSDYINPNKTTTNDIAAVLDVYGVEACRSNIVLELGNVFGGHGISVDNRHLNLIADYMTRNGGYTPFNRNGLRGNVSPFTKMSFETTLAFLKDAVLDGDWDDLTTPSSRLVMGRLGKTGTGAFDVLTKLPTRHSISAAE
ncbi:DNA-directed RNA polymerase I subunit rpa1 like protein [Verticillium longisporum]|nr:DNA-directed RNA polymerase I subunit rpa1 like protein [Verticillium longisporum]